MEKIHIFVKTSYPEHFIDNLRMITIDPKMNISYIKTKITKKTGILQENQQLSYEEKILMEHNTLDYYGITDESTIELKIITNIRIITTNNNNIVFDIDTYTNVINVKSIISEKINIPIEKQILIYNGQVIDNIIPLCYYNITNGSIIYLLSEINNDTWLINIFNHLANKKDILIKKDNNLCVNCLEQNRCYVFIDCGHLLVCDKCVLTVTKCSVCNIPVITRPLKVYYE